MTVQRTLRKKPAQRGATAPAKRRLRKVAAKRGARGPAIAELIATRLEEDIVLGRRHPRERLIEQDLCEQFRTHRADVRLAFFELEKKGIIQRIPIGAPSCAISRRAKSRRFTPCARSWK